MLASIKKDQDPWVSPCLYGRPLLFLPERAESDLFHCPSFAEKMQSLVRIKEALGCAIMPQEYTAETGI